MKISGSPLLIAALKPATPGKQKKAVKVSVGVEPEPTKEKEPSQHERKVEAAHYAHRAVVENWVRGEASDRKVKQSRSRLQKVIKGHI